MASPESSMVNKGKPHPPDLDDFLEFFPNGGQGGHFRSKV